MKIRRLPLLACAALFASVPLVVRAADLPPSARASSRLEELWRTTGTPALSLAVSVKGRVALSEGAGYIDLDNMVPAAGTSVYNIGSISKVHAAVAVMQLVEKGLVSLDDKVQKYVPSFPDKGLPITIRHLMTHTSGIRHYNDDDFAKAGGDENMLPIRSFEAAVAIFKDDPLLFKPGAFFSYSSYAVNLLQGVVEKATLRGFEDYMRENVWEPAGMLSTSFDVPTRVVPGRARSYVAEGSGVRNAAYGDVTYKFAGGGMLSSAEDLVRLGTALNRGRLLKPETIALMYKPATEPTVKRFDPNGAAAALDFEQALLWVRRKDPDGRTFMTHCGAVKSFRGCLVNYVEEDVILALLGNASTTPGGGEAMELARLFLPAVAKKP